MKLFFLVSALLFFFHFVYSQSRSDDFGGYFDPHPNRNIIIAPALLGPNALPVPRIRNGLVGQNFELRVNQSSHFMKGDNTFNIDGHLLAPVVRNFMALETQWYLAELFRSSNRIRDWRRLTNRDNGLNFATGDVHFSFLFQILMNRKNLPDAMLNIGVKTAIGWVEDGHYTNTPAYWTIIHFGKDIFSGKDFKFRLNGEAGFYAFQTNRERITQNEGPVLGMEAQFNYKQIELASSLSGYTCWEAVAEDDPCYWIIRLRNHRRRVDWHVEYQTGVHDYPYETFRVGFTWHIPSFIDFRKLNWREVMKDE